MARFGDDWLNGESGLANSLRTNEAVLWEQSAWTDMSARWDAFWSVREYALSTETHLTPVLSKTSALAAQWAADGSNGGGGNPLGAPSGGGDGDPQFLGDAIGDNISSTATIAVGGTLSSLIDHNGDVDYIRISLVAGQTYTFSLYGGTLSDPYLELRDAGGAIINDGVDTDDGGIGLNSFMMYTATSTADYWIVARHWNAASGTGTYTLDVNAIQTGNTSPTTLWDNGEGLPHYSWDEAAIQITRSGSSWASSFNTPTIVTYAYRSSAPTTMPDDTGGFSRFNAAQVTAAEATLAAWAAVANITFQRVDQGDGYSNNASILFGNYSTGAAGAAAFAYLPSSGNTAATNVQGDVWTNSTLAYNSNPILGEYGYQVLLHEIGHALGLSHPAEYNAAEGVSITYQNDAVYYEDSRVFTVMSYFGSLASNTGDLLLLASLPQMHDIAAIQRLYGANLTTRTGDTVYGYNSNTGVAEYMLTSTNQASLFAIWDGGGNDTLDLSGYTTASTIDLRQEAYSSAGPGNSGVADFNISIARGAVIENAIGGNGADTIIGNSANNVLNGGAGADTMTGNDGNDTYIVDNASDVVTESLNQGTDAVQASINYTLTANVENLTLTGAAITGTGNAANDVITGNSANNTLSGGDGADTLDGGGGNDIMAGGNQNDTYYVDSVSDVITETGGGGLADIVFASVSYTLAANVDNLTLIGTALNATGNSGNNILTGNAQNNILDGAGGIDDFFGGAGDDSYIVDGQDTVTEAAGEGADTVLSGGGAWTLGANFENITITNTGNSNAFGNELNNVLIGASGSNTLDGGLGADTMTGGLGDDRYYVDNAGDAVTELASEGDDWVFSTISYTLGANLERIILTGSANINATGNSGDNFVQGNTGANVLAGGLGVDTVYGDSGDDIINYTIGDGPDTLDGGGDFDTLNINDGAASSTLNVTLTGFLITSAAGATITQIDAVNANMGGGANSLTYNTTTALTVNLATAVATGFASIAGFVNVTGGSGDDLITGDAGNNTLNGGDGADTLVGGLGIDAINGGNGNDIINWAWGDGNGAIDGGGDFNTFNITGNASANILKVNLNGSTLIAAAGNTLNLIQAVNAAMGGGGDLLEYNAASTAATVNLTAGTASGFASISGIANATGGGGNDNLTGDATANKLLGGDGDDTLVGLDGVDTLIGGNGADTFYGGLGNDGITCDAGNDIVFWNWGDGGDTVNGGADFDTMTFIGTVDSNLFKIAFDGVKVTSIMGNPMSNIEAVVVNTGGGGDWLIYKSATTAITVNLATGVASGLTSFSGVSHVQGGTGDDIFTGDAAFNKLDGGDGNDTLSGGGDNDVLTGGNGNDTLTGGTGLDTISGGEGNDTIYWAWNDGGDSVDGGNGTDAITFTGDSAVNLIKASWNGTALTQVMSCTLTSVETVNAVGGGGADWLIYTATAGVTASLATNTASGFASIAGFANLQGGAGNDSLTGDGASNKITGGDGDDTITGLGGGDTLTGGLGNDTFVYAAGAGSDTIADFDANATGGQDLLDITGFGITAGDFGARVSIVDAGNQTIVTIDGSVVITLTGVDGNGANIITQADFLLGP